MLTTNVICRVFQIQHGSYIGTAFTIDIDDRQYLVTAKHCVDDTAGISSLGIFHENRWKILTVRPVGAGTSGADIFVFAPSILLSPAYAMPATLGDILLGQDLYFLGFPYEKRMDGGEALRSFPLAFVKRATLSAIGKEDGGLVIAYLDGHNNPGFSGGPVIFRPHGSREYRVAAVVSSFEYTDEPIYVGDTELPATFRYNTGIVVSHAIKHAVEAIRANPVGAPLKK